MNIHKDYYFFAKATSYYKCFLSGQNIDNNRPIDCVITSMPITNIPYYNY